LGAGALYNSFLPGFRASVNQIVAEIISFVALMRFDPESREDSFKILRQKNVLAAAKSTA
jgi:hypothetical protein